MKLSKPQLTPVWYWLTEAGTVFVNGCMSGIGAGAGTGAATGGVLQGTEVGATLSPVNKLILAVIGFVGPALSNGVKHFMTWHNTNRMPNPWPKPSEEAKP